MQDGTASCFIICYIIFIYLLLLDLIFTKNNFWVYFYVKFNIFWNDYIASDSSDWTDRHTSWYIKMPHTMYGVSENWLEYWTRTLSYHLIISIYPQLWIQTKINFVMYTSLDNIHCFHFTNFTVASKETMWPSPTSHSTTMSQLFYKANLFFKKYQSLEISLLYKWVL